MTRNWWIGGAVGAAALLAIGWQAGYVKAADLGGNCCADLEERIAELEATTARKGNRKVTLTVSGYVTHSVMWWDDGGKKDIFIGDGGAVSSRFRLVGSAKINQALTAGFLYEFGLQNNRVGSMNQTVPGGDDLGGNIEVRQSTAWMRHANLGMVKIGHGSTATDDLILIDLSGGNAVMFADPAVFNGSFGARVDSLTINGAAVPGAHGALTGLTWTQMLNGGVSFDTARRNHVLYETPSLAGFTVSAAVAENSFWDVALRYAGEFSGIKFAGGVGYSVDKEAPAFGVLGLAASEIRDIKGSASVHHTGTGLFVTAAGGKREIEFALGLLGHTLTAKDPSFWHVAAGINRKVFDFGATTLYGEYHVAKDMIGYSVAGPVVNGSLGSEATMWGFGAVQKIDAAAMDVFIAYKNFSGDVSGSLATPVVGSAKLDWSAFQTVIAGVKIEW